LSVNNLETSETTARETAAPRKLSLPRRIGYSLIVAVLFFLLLEGACSVAIVIKHAIFDQPLAERIHTEYDPELGWINRASFSHPDLYGPGRSLSTNSQRFRHPEDFTPEVPAGRLRLIVSGDSFALGYGVGDDRTWCAQLTALDPRLQVINMGQGGYGLDQAFLWHKRIRDDFEHDVHLFTFVTADFARMPHGNFSGYGKPVLTIQDGELEVHNTPVPRTSYFLSRLSRNGIEFQQLSTFRAARRLLSPNVPAAPTDDEALRQSREVTAAIARELRDHHQGRGSLLVLVHLPSNTHLGETDWNDFLREESQREGWIYLDLTGEFESLPESERLKLYLQPGEVEYPGASGHYNAEGNARVARLLHQRLLELEPFAERVRQLEHR
jgi:hypothetical protein